jgi:periplasmic mercuric ion binding protein
MKKLIPLLSLILLLGCTGKKDGSNPLLKEQTVTISLPTIVCSTCEKNIRKAIFRVEGVKDVDIDLDKKVAEVKFIPLQTNIETIEIAITEAGYDANNRKRNPEAYEKLDECCKAH